MKIRRSIPWVLLVLIAVSLAAIKGVAQNQSGFRFLEKKGPYAVGLKIDEQYDKSRTFSTTASETDNIANGDSGRPLQTLIWYPAKKSETAPLEYRDYIALEATETSFGRPEPITGLEARHLASMPESTRTQIMWAVRGATQVPGRFPVIIYAPSFSSVPWENAELCEYLASFGYVVIATPAMGEHRDSTHDVAGTNAQARDISFLIGFASSLGNADLSKVAVIGYSWGGIANLFAAARDSRIKALVTLEGSMRYFPGIVQAAGDVHPDPMRIPLLYFMGQHTVEDQDRLETMFHDPGPDVLNEWTHGDLLTVAMLGLIHPEFSSKGQRNEGLWKNEFARLQEADYDRQDGIIGYSWVARYTRAFLDAYLKQDHSAKEFLERAPVENGVPKHTMAARFRAAMQ